MGFTSHQVIENKRVYQMALYGLSGSGKTCLLAALAMDRYSNPFGFTVSTSNLSEKTSKEWLQQAINALENNDVPPPTPNTGERFTLEFTFSYRGQRYPVRMFDYAGELVSDKASDSDNAKSLFAALEGMDALLILAPVPHPSEDKQRDISKDLHDLRRTFDSLKGKQDASYRKLPIALIYNKWDLRSELEHETPENEWKELEEYLQLERLNSPNPYRHLYDSLKNILTYDNISYQPGALWRSFCAFKDGEPIHCNLMPFPLSAFGEYAEDADEKGKYHPKEINPLHAFGLEDPFLWAIFRCQEIEAETEDQVETATLERLNTEATRLDGMNRYLRFWELFSTSKLAKEAKQLRDRLTRPGAAARRYPELQTRRQLRRPQAETLYVRLRSAWLTQAVTATVTSVVLISTLTFTTEFAWDSIMLAKVQSIVDNPDSTPENRQWAETWQDAFAHSPVWQHIPYALLQKSKAQFAQELQAARTQRADRMAQNFTDTSKDISSRFDAAIEYLRICGQQCAHFAAAQAVQQEYRLAQDNAAWELAQQANTEDAITAYLEKYPLGQHIDNARQLLGQIMKHQAWQKFKLSYDNFLRDGKILEAAKLLEYRPTTQDANELQVRTAFADTAAGLLTTKVVEWKERSEWTEAMNYLQQIAQIPANVWAAESRHELVNNLSNDLKQNWDRTLYQAACVFRNQDKMNEYLTLAPLRTMKSEIESYLAYLNQRSGDNSFQLQLTQVQWNGNVKAKTYATYSLSVNNENATSPQMDGPLSDKAPTINLLIDFTAKYTDTVAVAVQAVGTGLMSNLFGERLIGVSGNVNLTVQNILRGAQLTLRDESGAETGQAFLTLSGGAGNAPELPSWRAP